LESLSRFSRELGRQKDGRIIMYFFPKILQLFRF
jgi:hypothetical protein